MRTSYEVVIVGGGVSGAALAYALSLNTNIKHVALLEKRHALATVNSHPLNNAQTSHDGGTETNYDLEHAKVVQVGAKLLRSYLESKRGAVADLFAKTDRMVVGVGEAEVSLLKERLALFAKDYPDLRYVGRDELSRIEPAVVRGRDPHAALGALVSSEGYAVNYQRLSQCLVADAQKLNPELDVYFNTGVRSIRRVSGGFEIDIGSQTIHTKFVACTAGAYSLQYAQSLGLGTDLALLNIAGNFFSGPRVLNGKVYTIQIDGLPFAAVHGDPDVVLTHETRFGPTTMPLPMMIRHDYTTVLDYLRLSLLSLRGLNVLRKILWSKQMLGYVALNFLYALPGVGKALFLREARKIVPTLRYSDLSLRRGVGGVRPQIVNLTTGRLEMGDKTLVGEGCVFNTTPSPGASVCLLNARRDARVIAAHLGANYADKLLAAA